MLQKVRDVLNTIRAKRSNEDAAERLNMDQEEYVNLKRKILLVRQLVGEDEEEILQALKVIDNVDTSFAGTHEVNYDLEKGEAKISAVVSEEPRSAEDIVRLLKIDTKEWKLSQYWNKQKSNGWVISALVTKIKPNETDYFENLIKNWTPKAIRVSNPGGFTDSSKPGACAVLSLQDIHFGKEGNETVDKDFEETIKSLATRASAIYDLEKLVYVVGGDLINMDTFGGTTTSGTPVDNSATAPEAYMQAYECLAWSVAYLSQFTKELHVVYIPGNHDRLSSFHLAHALSKSVYAGNIVWDVEYSERKVITYGQNFFGFEHGDVKTNNSLLVYATENPKEWGQTLHRTLYTGHLHTKRKVEYITSDEKTGFAIKVLPSLSRTDYWHYHNKFVGNKRSGVIDIHLPDTGITCELTYSPV